MEKRAHNMLQNGCPSCHPTNSVKALKGKIYHIPWTCLPRAHLGD